MSDVQKTNKVEEKVVKSESTHNFGILFNKKLLLLFLIVLSIPVTVILSSQRQDLVNHAAAPTAPKISGYIIEFKDPPLLAKTTSGVSSTSTTEKPTQDSRINIENQHILIKKNILNILGADSFTSESNSSLGTASVPDQKEITVFAEYENVFNGVALGINSVQAAQLKSQSPYVKAVYPNLEIKELLMDSVPLIKANQVWNLKDSKGLNITGKNINIAVIDTGVDYRHADLGRSTGSQVYNSKVVNGYDFADDDDDPIDYKGHGTHVAEIIAGNGILRGVAPEANIIAYKVFKSDTGTGDFATVMQAIDAAVETHKDDDSSNDVNIINISLGSSPCYNSANGTYYDSTCGPDAPLSRAVDNATSWGIVVVVAAGNYGDKGASTITMPGTARSAITVGSINDSKVISSFSSKGPVISGSEIIQKPDVVAPGELICSARYSGFVPADPKILCLDSDHVKISGTSMAAPHVAGFAALIMQKYPQFSSSDIKYLITQNALNLSYDVNTQGKGMIDASKLFNLTETQPTITPVPSVSPPAPTGTLSTSIFMTVTAYQDSFVNQDKPTTNYGDYGKIRIDGNPKEIAYLKFDLTPLAGKKIISAKLKLKVQTADGSGSSNKFVLKKVDISDWSEGGVKYSNKPSLGALVTTFTGKGVGNLIQVNVLSWVNSSLGNKAGLGIASDGSNELILNSRNASSNRPLLYIEYQ